MGEPVVVVSNDTHIGPRLVEDLRDYCPATHLDDFDRFAATTAAEKDAAAEMLRGSGYLDHPNLRTPGHHGTPIDRVPEGASVTAFRSGAGGWG
jgi:hypothetical protein